MKQNINLIKVDSSFREWLIDKLANDPPISECVDDIKTALQEMSLSTNAGILLCEQESQTEVLQNQDNTEKLCFGNLFIFPKSRKVFLDNEKLNLTPKEYDILFFLAKNKGEVFTKEQIYQAVWDDKYLLDDSNIMAFIRKLRKKIEIDPDSPNFIITIWGIGYKFNDEL